MTWMIILSSLLGLILILTVLSIGTKHYDYTREVTTWYSYSGWVYIIMYPIKHSIYDYYKRIRFNYHFFSISYNLQHGKKGFQLSRCYNYKDKFYFIHINYNK